MGGLLSLVDHQSCSWAEARCHTWGCCHFVSLGNVGGRPNSVTPPPPTTGYMGGRVGGSEGGWVGEPRFQRGHPPPPPVSLSKGLACLLLGPSARVARVRFVHWDSVRGGAGGEGTLGWACLRTLTLVYPRDDRGLKLPLFALSPAACLRFLVPFYPSNRACGRRRPAARCAVDVKTVSCVQKNRVVM